MHDRNEFPIVEEKTRIEPEGLWQSVGSASLGSFGILPTKALLGKRVGSITRDYEFVRSTSMEDISGGFCVAKSQALGASIPVQSDRSDRPEKAIFRGFDKRLANLKRLYGDSLKFAQLDQIVEFSESMLQLKRCIASFVELLRNDLGMEVHVLGVPNDKAPSMSVGWPAPLSRSKHCTAKLKGSGVGFLVEPLGLLPDSPLSINPRVNSAEFDRLLSMEDNDVNGRKAYSSFRCKLLDVPVVILQSVHPSQGPLQKPVPFRGGVFGDLSKLDPNLPKSQLSSSATWKLLLHDKLHVPLTPDKRAQLTQLFELLGLVVNTPSLHFSRSSQEHVYYALGLTGYDPSSGRDWSTFDGDDFVLKWKVNSDNSALATITGKIQADMLKLVCLLFEVGHHTEWIPFMSSSERVCSFSDATFTLKYMLNLPKPMDSRQAVLIGHGMDLLQTKHRAIVLSAASVPDTCTSAAGLTMPPTGHGVTRLHFKKFVALFQLTDDPKVSKGTIFMYVDPFFRVPVPKLLQNYFARAMAPKLFKNIQSMCQEENWSKTPYPAIMRANRRVYDVFEQRIKQARKR